MNTSTHSPPFVLSFLMLQDELKQAVAQTHFDAYATAIKNGKTSAQAMQIADALATAKYQLLRTATS